MQVYKQTSLKLQKNVMEEIIYNTSFKMHDIC